MALINKDGMSISSECTELIEDLENDIKVYGGKTMIEVVTEQAFGVTIYKDYKFLDDEDFTLKESERTEKITMQELLEHYKKQNSIF